MSNDPKTPELKSCPFCGSFDVGLDYTGDYHHAWCRECQAEGPPCVTERQAGLMWNIRDGEVSRS